MLLMPTETVEGLRQALITAGLTANKTGLKAILHQFQTTILPSIQAGRGPELVLEVDHLVSKPTG
jgi:hypothetical protein